VLAASLAASLALWLSANPAVPKDAECAALPALPGSRLPFGAGEKLDYDVDLLGGVKIGTVEMEVGKPEKQNGRTLLPIVAHAAANGLAAAIGQVKSDATTWLSIHDLHPVHFREDYTQPDGSYWTDVSFPPARPHQIHFNFSQPNGKGERNFAYANDALDVVGAFFLLSALEPKLGDHLCFDVYGARHMWRVWGEVTTREPISTPAGTFSTLRLSGHAARLDKLEMVREMYLWLTDDARHLPVASMGDLEIGPLRALLTGMGSKRAETDREP
jgi:hypothetical protein